MILEIVINMDSDAFNRHGSSKELELSLIFSQIRVEVGGYGRDSGTCKDSNGNTVGSFTVT